MNAMKNKIQSQRGASITFALLLFLVCAVVSAVVIVASTTASGRMSSLPDIDQRYYAVNSAAELLRATLNDKAITVIKEQTRTITKSYDKNGTMLDENTTYSTTQSKYYAGDYTKDSTVSVVNSSYSLLAATTDILTENEQLFEEESNGTSDPRVFPIPSSLTLTASGTLDMTGITITEQNALALLSVDIRESLSEDGTLTFYVSKSIDNNSTLGYTLRLVFEPERTENVVTKSKHGSPRERDTVGNYKITDEETRTKTIVYKWTLIGVNKQ